MCVKVLRYISTLSLAVILLGLVPACAGLELGSARVGVGGGDVEATLEFSSRDRELIRAYFKEHGLPPGIAKREDLPPGQQKQIQKKGTLPPGIAKRALPGRLESQLSPLPEGYVRVMVGVDIVLLDTRTQVVIDIIKDIGG
jgi:hypothetical protein